MPSRLSRLSTAVAAALLLTACSMGSSVPPMSAEIPPNLTDEWLAESLVPQFWGRRANEGAAAPSVERVADKPGTAAAFFGTPEVRGTSCKRWAGGLRHSARDLARLDAKARIAGASYGGMYRGKTFILGTALMVARPPLLDAMAKDPLAGCRRVRARVATGFSVSLSHAKATDYRWVEFVAEPVPDAARLGDWSAAYRYRWQNESWFWVKEVRFGPYMLQVSLTGTIPVIGAPGDGEHIDVAKLDEAAAAAYEHAHQVLSGPSPVPTMTYPSPPPISTPIPTLSSTDLRAALLTRFDGARGGPPFPNGVVTRPLRTGRLDPRRNWLNSFGLPDATGCEPYAQTLWYAVDGEKFWFEQDKSHLDPTTIALTSLRGPGPRFITETIVQSDSFIGDVLWTPPERCESFTADVGGREAEFTVKILWDTGKAAALAITRKDVNDAPTYVSWRRLDAEHLMEIRVGTVGIAESPGLDTETLRAVDRDARERAKRYLR